jgi:hypothetical protein
MSLNISTRAAERQTAIDRLRLDTERGLVLTAHDGELRAILDEVQLLEIVAGAADSVVLFPGTPESGPAMTALRDALRRWKD